MDTYETRLKDIVLQESLDEVAHFLEQADPPDASNATSAHWMLEEIAWYLRFGGA
jgi:hypothetical protein